MAANLGFETTLAHDACAAFTTCVQTSWNPKAAAADGNGAGAGAGAGVGAGVISAEEIHNAAINHIHGEFVTALSTQDVIIAQQSEVGSSKGGGSSVHGRHHPDGSAILVKGTLHTHARAFASYRCLSLPFLLKPIYGEAFFFLL